MSEWRPIESAPKNGQCFILGRGGIFSFTAPAMYNNYGVLQTLDCPSDPGFFGDGLSSEYGKLEWMPLPVHPK